MEDDRKLEAQARIEANDAGSAPRAWFDEAIERFGGVSATISLADVCLPCYANRSYDVAIMVDGATTKRQVRDEMEVQGSDEWSDARYDAYEAAIKEMFQDNDEATMDDIVFPDLETADEDDASESMHAYFDVEFDDE